MSNARELAQIPSTPSGRRNLIINGAMNVAQRGTTSSGFNFKTVDRFRFDNSDVGQLAITQSQVADAPDGFTNSYKVAIDTAETAMEGNDLLYMHYTNEAKDCQHLEYGSSNAKTLTLSFWVKSSVTGTYTVLNFIQDSDRARTLTYTVNTANTWEYKTIVYTGDTASGKTINSDDGQGLHFFFTLGAGDGRTTTDAATSWIDYASSAFAYGQTANVAGTTNATWQVTGVQLEVGTVATEFEHRSFGEELALCQRYFQYYENPPLRGVVHTSTRANRCAVILPVMMRANPSLTLQQIGSISHFRVYDGTATATYSSFANSYLRAGKIEFDFNVTGSSLTVGRAACLFDSDAYESAFLIDAEL